MRVSKRVRDAVRARLQNEIDGLNPMLEAACREYGIPEIRFNWAGSTQFFQGWIDPADIEGTTVLKYPLLLLYTVTVGDLKAIKFKRFSGNVQIGMEVHVSLLPKFAPADMESYQDAVEDAVVACMHGDNHDAEFAAAGAHFMRDTQFQRQPVQTGGENWIVSQVIGMSFEVHQ